MVAEGSQWRIGDGFSLNIWEARWLPRPMSFKVITPFNPHFALLRVGDLINKDTAEWNLEMLHKVFLPIDVEVIKDIPLSNAWPPNRVIWHGSPNGELTVKLAYHFIRQMCAQNAPSGSTYDLEKHWQALWEMDVPPRIRLFAWRVCVGALPSAYRLGSRIPSFSMCCSMCGASMETDVHALVDCPLASLIWKGSRFDNWIVEHVFTS